MHAKIGAGFIKTSVPRGKHTRISGFRQVNTPEGTCLKPFTVSEYLAALCDFDLRCRIRSSFVLDFSFAGLRDFHLQRKATTF